MDVMRPCDICSKPNTALNTCWKCGAVVCVSCFDNTKGTCIKCARGADPVQKVKI